MKLWGGIIFYDGRRPYLLSTRRKHDRFRTCVYTGNLNKIYWYIVVVRTGYALGKPLNDASVPIDYIKYSKSSFHAQKCLN